MSYNALYGVLSISLSYRITRCLPSEGAQHQSHWTFVFEHYLEGRVASYLCSKFLRYRPRSQEVQLGI